MSTAADCTCPGCVEPLVRPASLDGACYLSALAWAERDEVRADAYHNNDTEFFEPYTPPQTLTRVFTRVWRTNAPIVPAMACEQIFELLNIGDDPAFGIPDPQAVSYRKRGNRSLSIGDVVSLTPAGAPTFWYALTRRGWEPIAAAPTIAPSTRRGTCPLPDNGQRV